MAFYSVSGPVIPAGESLSNAVECSSSRIVRIIMPESGWDAAPLSFRLSLDNETFANLYNIQTIVGGFQQFEVVVPKVEPGAIHHAPEHR